MANLQKALDWVFQDEGGFSNIKNDTGGATNWGITRDDASRYYRRPVSVEEMRNLPKATAITIYQNFYWFPMACDRIMDDGVATAMFDIGVVRGIGVPPLYAQEILNSFGSQLVEDGHIGPRTLAALNICEPSKFIAAFSKRCEDGFREIVNEHPMDAEFLDGWLNRARRLLRLS